MKVERGEGVKNRSMRLRLTEKGEALLLAIDCGLCPKDEKGYAIASFERFWMKYEQIKERKESRTIFISALLGCIFTKVLDFLFALI